MYVLLYNDYYLSYRYNPASILQIDMFNTSEEKLQDQLTKTMSVVFEGKTRDENFLQKNLRREDQIIQIMSCLIH